MSRKMLRMLMRPRMLTGVNLPSCTKVASLAVMIPSTSNTAKACCQDIAHLSRPEPAYCPSLSAPLLVDDTKFRLYASPVLPADQKESVLSFSYPA